MKKIILCIALPFIVASCQSAKVEVRTLTSGIVISGNKPTFVYHLPKKNMYLDIKVLHSVKTPGTRYGDCVSKMSDADRKCLERELGVTCYTAETAYELVSTKFVAEVV